MISYYTSKHPGLYIYLTLLSLTVVAVLLFPLTSKVIGLFSILWGVFLIMRTLSLYEVSEHFSAILAQKTESKNQNNMRSSLAYDLAQRQKSRNHMTRGLHAMRSLNKKSIIWLSLAALYCCVYILENQSTLPMRSLINNLCLFFIIGAAFWSGQTYAYSHTASRIMTGAIGLLSLICCILLTPSIMKFEPSYDNMVLALLCAYTALCLIYALKSGTKRRMNALCGLVILTCLIVFNHYALWLAGLSLLSVFWIRSAQRKESRYVLYQCE